MKENKTKTALKALAILEAAVAIVIVAMMAMLLIEKESILKVLKYGLALLILVNVRQK